MNIFVLVTSVLIILRGVEYNRALLLNAGLIWLSSLILMRFFDSDASILLKGLVFIVIGTSFIAMNIWFNRKNKSSSGTKTTESISKETAHD